MKFLASDAVPHELNSFDSGQIQLTSLYCAEG